MGYSTEFYGFWTLTPALSLAQTDYLQKFSRTRRVNVYQEIIDDPGNEGAKVTQIVGVASLRRQTLRERNENRDNIFRVIHHSKAGMLIYSRYWDSIWLPDNLVDRFLVIPDKLAVRCLIAIEPIDDSDCQYRLVKCADGNSREHLYPTNSLWQIDHLLEGDRIIALDPSGNRIEIDRSGLDCFVSIDIVLQEVSIV
jgi:hypothetical protein